MRTISLLATCMIAGLPRSPVEGVQTVDDDEGQRLVDAGMAEFVEIEDAGESEEGDGLDKKTVTQLKKIVKDDKITVEGATDKDGLIAAIRKHREQIAAPDGLDDLADDALKTRAAADGVEVSDDRDAMISAIREKLSRSTA